LGLTQPRKTCLSGEGCPSFISTTQAVALGNVGLIPSLHNQHSEGVGGCNESNTNATIRRLGTDHNQCGTSKKNIYIELTIHHQHIQCERSGRSLTPRPEMKVIPHYPNAQLYPKRTYMLYIKHKEANIQSSVQNSIKHNTNMQTCNNKLS